MVERKRALVDREARRVVHAEARRAALATRLGLDRVALSILAAAPAKVRRRCEIVLLEDLLAVQVLTVEVRV